MASKHLHRHRTVGRDKILWLIIPLIFFTIYWPKDAASPVEQRPISNNSTISTFPKTVIQGEPALIVLNDVEDISSVASLTFNNKPLWVFNYNSKPSALVGIDLNMKAGIYPIVLTLDNGYKFTKDFVVSPRIRASAPLGIPDKLGGNTPEAEKDLVTTLVQEGTIINNIQTANEKLWQEDFRFPLDGEVIVSDIYGYSRITGNTTINHKGTDFKASEGTPVYAINSGVVRLAQNLRNYGDVVVIDHGLGILSVYMHLSEIGVTLDQEVEKGALLGKSGQSGYVFGPHLHLTIRIGGVSIDPIKFMEIFGLKL